MPVFSYVAYPVQGAKEKLLNDLAALEELQKKLKELKSLQSLGMTFGHTDE
jgi:hypothetical protein